MINNIITSFRALDKIAKIIMKKGLVFCFFIALIALCILLTYIFYPITTFFAVGLSLLRSSMIFSIEFIICGFVADKIKKQLI